MAGINKVILDLYISGRSISQVHKITGIPMSTLRFRLKKAGVLRTPGDALRLAGSLGRLGSGNRGKSRVFTQEWKDNISKAKKGKGYGVTRKKNGYIEITMGPNKFRNVHDVLMEIHIGRKLRPHECVHHVDHNRTNNNLSNLQLMTRSEHARLHALENCKKRERNELGRFV